MKNQTTQERKSERELGVTRTFNAPARLVFEAWTKPELPRSAGRKLFGRVSSPGWRGSVRVTTF